MTEEQTQAELDAESELAAQHIGAEAMERSPERFPEGDEDEEPPDTAPGG